MSTKVIDRQVPQVLYRNPDQRFASVEAALVANKLDWGVEKHPLFARIPDSSDPSHGLFKRFDNRFAVCRTDTKAPLGDVSGDYIPKSQAEVLAPLEELFSAGEFTIRRAGERHGGAMVWLEASGPSLTVAKHTIETGITVSFRHDGKGKVNYRGYFRRRSCFNELRAILGYLLKVSGADGGGDGNVSLSFRHTKGAAAGILEVPRHLERIAETRALFKSTAEQLLSATFTRSEMEELVRTLWGPRPAPRVDNKREVSSWDSRFYAVMEHAWGASDLVDERFTRWGALNAIADYEQHLVRVTGTPAQRDERLMARVIENGPIMREASRILLP